MNDATTCRINRTRDLVVACTPSPNPWFVINRTARSPDQLPLMAWQARAVPVSISAMQGLAQPVCGLAAALGGIGAQLPLWRAWFNPDAQGHSAAAAKS
jgi:hypothetical protein